jgi:hypothetical protein
VLRDPAEGTTASPGPFARFAARFICDPRDVAFVRLAALQSVIVIPTGLALFLPGPFRWWLAAVHLTIVLYWIAPFVLMLHNTSHRRLFKRPWGWMNQYIPWVLGPFFGETPETYFGHHVGMHHPENNLEGDLSSTMHYQRDSAVDFVRYFLRFFFLVLFELGRYFAKRGRRALFVRVLTGELLFYVFVVLLFCLNWRATLMVFAAPFAITRFAMMAGNWAQHAFVDASAPGNCYRNSITCINSVYNQRCFNDGYHIGHHIKATRHWLEMPGDFLNNVATYEAERALVFEGVDYFQVWLALMFKRYDWLAGRIVQLGSVPRPRSELVALMHERLRRIDAAPEPALAAPAE